MNKKTSIIVISAIAIIVIAIILIFALKDKNPATNTDETQTKTISAAFSCQDDKTIQAIFYLGEENTVGLTLSDGRTLEVPRAISASGARYANEDESFVFWNKGDTAFIEENGTTTFQNCIVTEQNASTSTPDANIANPASVNCEQKGGKLTIAKKPDGSEYGLCYFDDNRACEEWAMLNGDCAVGGVKTTGFDTDAQKFCAWSGGKTFAVENAVCTFNDGSTCLADEFYAGTCQKGENLGK